MNVNVSSGTGTSKGIVLALAMAMVLPLVLVLGLETSTHLCRGSLQLPAESGHPSAGQIDLHTGRTLSHMISTHPLISPELHE